VVTYPVIILAASLKVVTALRCRGLDPRACCPPAGRV
jgi:hypothetical protein